MAVKSQKSLIACILSLLLLLVGILSYPSVTHADPPTYSWSKRLGTTSVSAQDNIQSIKLSNGNVFSLGVVTGVTDLNGDGDATDGGAESVGGLTNADLVISTFNFSGTHQWSKRIGTTNSDTTGLIQPDADGNLIFVGRMNGNADTNNDGDTSDGGAESATGYGNNDGIIVYYNAAGTYQWSKRIGSTGADTITNMLVTSTGKVVVIGNTPALAFDLNGDGDKVDSGESATGYGSQDTYVTVFDVDGTHLWGKRLGTTGSDSGLYLSIDTDDNIVIGGSMAASNADLNGDGDSTDGGAESSAARAFLTVFDVSGTHQWAKRIELAFGSFDMTVDGDNNILIGASHSGDADVNGDGDATDGGAESSTGYGSTDMIITTFNSAGTHQWAKRLGGASNESIENIATDSNNGFIIYFNAPAAVMDLNGDGDATDTSVETDVSGRRGVTVFNSAGTHQWAKRFGNSSSWGIGVHTDIHDNIIMTGNIDSGNMDMNGDGDSTDGGAEDATGYGTQDVWMTTFSSTGVHQWAKRFGGDEYDDLTPSNTFATDADGHMAFSSDITEAADLNGDGDKTDGGESTGYSADVYDYFITFWNIDQTAPVASDISADPAVDVTIDWTTDEASSSVVEYGLTTSYGTSTTEEDTDPRVTSHSVTISGLATCTVYHYRVKSTDSETNTVTSADDTFTTSGCPTSTPTPSPTPIPSTSSSSSSEGSDGSEDIQIPQSSDGTNLTGGALTPIRDSQTNSQIVTVIIEPGTLSSDAYVSAQSSSLDMGGTTLSNPITGGITSSLFSNTVTAGGNLSGGGILGIKTGACIAWQVGSIQKIWYKTYPPLGSNKPSAIIIPELQRKPSIIGLSYREIDLISAGNPSQRFLESRLKLAHSIDGSVWRIMPTSVVDPINNTVASLEKVGGYYMIVASCRSGSARTFAPSTLGESTVSEDAHPVEKVTDPVIKKEVAEQPTQPVVKTESFFQRVTKVVRKILNLN